MLPCTAGVFKGYFREKDISAIQPEKTAETRFQGPHEDQERAKHNQQQEAERPDPIERKRVTPRRAMKNLGFPRSRRLARQFEFRRLYRAGHRKSNKYLTVYTCPANGRRGKVGIVAGKRLGKAVERNRIRRILREAIRTNQHGITEKKDLAIVVKPPALELPRHELVGRLLELLRKSEAIDA